MYCPLDIRPDQNIQVPVTPKIRENSDIGVQVIIKYNLPNF
jgi:hypothetical protein